MNTDYLVTGEATAIRENGATSGVGVLASYGYDNLGNRTSVTFGNGAAQAFSYDAVSRLASLTNDLSGTSNDLSVTFGYNPGSQIASTVRTGDTYAWTGHGNGSTAFTQNGLNQQITIGGSSATWDSKGNLTTEPQSGKTYGYSSENLLTSATGGVTLAYDPALRLYQIAGAATTRFAYDGVNEIAEYDGSNALQRRFVFGPRIDEPIVQYEGSGTTDRRFMGTEERGSVISLTDSSGTLLNINRYDEYGKPQITNSGRFQYTGQKWIGEAGLYDYKARDYLPHLGIFAQTDPIGYDDSANPYAYVLNDPVNLVDPLGRDSDDPRCPPDTASCGKRLNNDTFSWEGSGSNGVGVEINNFLDNLIVDDPQPPSPLVTCDAADCSTGVTITGARKDKPFVVVNGKYVYSGYQKPAYSNAFDAAFGCLAVCPLAAAGAIVYAPVIVEGESVGYVKYARGTKWQVRILKNAVKIRYDVNKPITHINLEIGPYNFHIPPW